MALEPSHLDLCSSSYAKISDKRSGLTALGNFCALIFGCEVLIESLRTRQSVHHESCRCDGWYRFGLVGDGMGYDDRTGFFFWEWFMALDRSVGSAKSCRPKSNPATKMLLRLTVQRNEPAIMIIPLPLSMRLFFIALLLVTGSSPFVLAEGTWSPWIAEVHDIRQWDFFSLSSLILLETMWSAAPRPPRPAGSPSSSVSSGFSGSFHRECERSPRTPLPLPAPLHAPGPVYLIPRTPMTDARRYRSLFSHRRVAPPTPPYLSPPPSDEEPSEGTVDPAAELEGDPDEPYLEDIVYPAGY
ncbi:hypothetical protein PIB30_035335 [Stylosanthes scabra]|uniref:Uncharacterized protein n=1 Tax=Stylosanthes scabra TaxID=79078 RepID=A0ABU6TCU9_9FABA|nr:hypothetical protein [Stylosanthes scabra]